MGIWFSCDYALRSGMWVFLVSCDFALSLSRLFSCDFAFVILFIFTIIIIWESSTFY